MKDASLSEEPVITKIREVEVGILKGSGEWEDMISMVYFVGEVEMRRPRKGWSCRLKKFDFFFFFLTVPSPYFLRVGSSTPSAFKVAM